MRIFIVLFLSFVVFTSSLAQRSKSIDRIFNDWNQPNHPGGVIYVTKGNKIIHAKAYGLANLSNAEHLSTASVFNLASVSKQFTAVGILLLQQEGKLSVNDSIGKYLPELPAFMGALTIKQLLHHTSGLRSTPELFTLAGWQEGDEITTADVLKRMCQQTDLNFTPDSEFMYSNTNYVLLSVIIARVTQQDFASWMKTNVFELLGMLSAFIDETNVKPIPKKVTPYMELEPNHFEVAQNSSHETGAANMYATAADLLHWLQVINRPSERWKAIIEELLTVDTLLNGRSNNYAYGVINDEFKGHRRIYHNGGLPGYLSFGMSFPEEQLEVVVLMNVVDNRAQLRVDQLLNVLLSDQSKPSMTLADVKKVTLNSARAKQFENTYWNTTANYVRSVVFENDTLWYQRTNGTRSPLWQVEDSVFVLGGIKTVVWVRFHSSSTGYQMSVKDGDQPEQFFEVVDATVPTRKELEKYCGTFYSPELQTSYTISLGPEGLVGYHEKHGSFPIQYLGKDLIDWSGFATARYSFEGEKTGLYVSLNRVRNVWFEKTTEDIRHKTED